MYVYICIYIDHICMPQVTIKASDFTFCNILLCSLASGHRALFLIQETTQELLLLLYIYIYIYIFTFLFTFLQNALLDGF